MQPFELKQRLRSDCDGWILNVELSPSGAAVATSNTTGIVHIFDVGSLSPRTSAFERSSLAVHDIKFGNDGSDNFLWRATSDGRITLVDLRSNVVALNIYAGSAIHCLSLDNQNLHLAAGSELAEAENREEEAPVMLWDLRSPSKTLAKFCDAHSDDVTQVRFHPENHLKLASSGTDGLINIFNLQTLEEDDALDTVIKTDSVSKIGFFGPRSDYLFSHTHIETFAIYNGEGEPLKLFGDIRQPSLNNYPALDYVIGCQFDVDSGRLFSFAGDKNGNIGIYNIGLNGLEPVSTLLEGHTEIVRDICWSKNSNFIVSGGEDGMLCFWAQG
ncbi:WD40-repeat-containing domain protein [Chytridium lagenaria]|nr:WD40-repeat-containing domain protein [Chytridium lagenaria]